MRKFVLVVMLVMLVSGCKSEVPQSVTQNSVEPSTQAASASTKEPAPTTGSKTKDFLYENKKLGFSLVFPASWAGKYQIEDKDSEHGIRINFKLNAEQTVFLHDIRVVTKEEWMNRKNEDY